MISRATTSRRHRAALAAALALVGLPLLTSGRAEAAECPAETSCVIITFVTTTDGVTTTAAGPYSYPIDGNELLRPDPLDYTVRAKKGDPAEPVVEGGIPDTLALKDLLDAAVAEESNDLEDPVRFSETPNGTVPSVLDGPQLDGTTPFSDGLLPAVYATADHGVAYVRPLLPDDDDVNVGDVFTTGPGEPLELTFHIKGDLLGVSITSSPTKIDTSTTASFSAKITPSTDEKLKYAWNFTGGASVQSTQATPTHKYAKKGSYAVSLSVRGADGSYGRASTAQVKVGAPPRPPSTGGGGTGGGTGGFGGGYIPPYVPGPTLSDLPTDELADQDPVAPVDDGLEQVEGFVLVGAGAGEGESIPGTQDVSRPTRATELSTSRKISGAAIGALAVALLLGLGAEIETRWISTRLGHLRGRT